MTKSDFLNISEFHDTEAYSKGDWYQRLRRAHCKHFDSPEFTPLMWEELEKVAKEMGCSDLFEERFKEKIQPEIRDKYNPAIISPLILESLRKQQGGKIWRFLNSLVHGKMEII